MIAQGIPRVDVSALTKELSEYQYWRRTLVPLLEERRPMPAGGTILGIECIGEGYDTSCSWLSNHVDTECKESLGIVAGELGLIQNATTANEVIRGIREDRFRAEQVQWSARLLVDCTSLLKA